jgi:hypothetical protein
MTQGAPRTLDACLVSFIEAATQFLVDKEEHTFYNVRTGCDQYMMIAARTVFGGMWRFLEVAALRDRGDRH